MHDLNDEFEALMEQQFQLDLVSDRQVENQELYDEAVRRCEININSGIRNCLKKMNQRGY